MNTYNAQNPSEMLHLLFDGELDSAMETPLYASLMQSEELRSELRELIAIRESIRKDVEAYTPPVAATQGVFSRLGYHPPVPQKGTDTVPIGFLGLMKQKLWNPAVTAVLAALITALLFWNYNSIQGTSNQEEQLALSGKNSIKSSVVPKTVIGSERIANDNNNSVPPQKSIVYRDRIKYVYVTEKDENSQVKPIEQETLTSDVKNTIGENSEDSKSLLSMVSPVTLFSNEPAKINPLQETQNSNQREFILANNFYPKTDGGPSLLLQLKGMSVTSFPNVEFDDDAAGGMLRNFSIGAYVPLSKNIYFGLEGGQEPFSQIFYHIENNQLYKIEQNPVLMWAGFGIKFNMNEKIEFLANAQPFMNLTIASTRVGPYGKAIGGLQFVSDNGIGVMLGFESGILVYQEQKKLYSTEKLGITYGMFMNF